MKFNFLKTEPKEILDFEKEIGVELVVSRGVLTDDFYVTFEGSLWGDNTPKYEVGGTGKTIDKALHDYCTKISSSVLKVRQTIICTPHLVHTRKVEIPKEEKPETDITNRETARGYTNSRLEHMDCTVAYHCGFEDGVFSWLNSQEETK